MSWRRLSLLCEQLAGMPGTALWRQARGVDADWTLEVSVLTSVLHTLQVANWQRGADEREGKARRNYPAPILPPSQRPIEGKSKVSAAALIEFRERTKKARANTSSVGREGGQKL